MSVRIESDAEIALADAKEIHEDAFEVGADEISSFIRNGDSVLRVRTVEEPPVFNWPEGTKASCFVPMSEISPFLSVIYDSMSHDMSRPVLASVAFVFSEEHLQVVSADGFRLALSPRVPVAGNIDGTLLLPLLAVKALQSLGPEVLFEVPVWQNLDNMAARATLLKMWSPEGEVLTELQQGTFPYYKPIVEKASALTFEEQTDTGPARFMAQRKNLLQALKSIGLDGKQNGSTPVLGIKVEGDEVTLYRVTSAYTERQVIEAAATVPVLGTKGQGRIAFNSRYFIEGLHGDVLTIEWRNASEGAYIQGDMGYVLMPMCVDLANIPVERPYVEGIILDEEQE